MPCIYYPIQFRKDKGVTIWALIDSGSKVNAITLAYSKQLGLHIWKTNVWDQKIDRLLLRTFGIVIAGFKVGDKLGKAQFF